MKSRLLGYDPVTKVKRMFHPSLDGDSFIEEATQDVTDRLEVNKAILNTSGGRWGDGKRVASVPLVVAEDLMRKGIWNDPKALKRWLNDPDNRAFRVRGGRV